jgi:hypothetical protein
MTPIAERKVGSKPMPDNITSLSNPHLPENLYERDYYTWAFEQARALEERRAMRLTGRIWRTSYGIWQAA